MGFNALASLPEDGPGEVEPAEVERGPGYGGRIKANGPDDWPTYRGDAARSGVTKAAVPAELEPVWRRELGGELTAPTIAGGKVYVASANEHEVHALDTETGESKWRFTAGGRIDSPPTLHDGRAIFGCRDGYVYGVRASDGALAWRLRAARRERRIVANGQLESASPVIGSVLIDDGIAYCTAGRSSYLDGGIDLCRVEPKTGEALSRTPVYSPDPETGMQPPQSAPAVMPGARADILTSDDGHVYLRDMVFGKDGAPMDEGEPHIFTLTDFLDHSWAHRSYWMWGTIPSANTGCSGRSRDLVFGRVLVTDESAVYGYGREQVHWSNMLEDGPYRLFSVGLAEGAEGWEVDVPIQVRAMVLAGDVLFIAGPDENVGDPLVPSDMGALLMAISAKDGSELARYELDDTPLMDAMAAAGGKLYMVTEGGGVVCMG